MGQGKISHSVAVYFTEESGVHERDLDMYVEYYRLLPRGGLDFWGRRYSFNEVRHNHGFAK